MKTGGTSIEQVFWGKPIHKHKGAGFHKLNHKEWDNYFKFTFVRNPWDRICSLWWNRQYYPPRKQPPAILPFNEWVNKWFLHPKKRRKGHPQPSQLKRISCNGKIELDFIGRFENLQNDFNIVCDKIGIKRITLPHHFAERSPSDRKPYTEYYDEETKELYVKKT
jgi:hypothetical protein